MNFKIVQIQKCLFPRTFKYKIASTHATIAKLTLDKAIWVGTYNSKISQNFCLKPKKAFKPGQYIISIKLGWNHDDITEFSFNILAKQPIEYHVVTDPYDYESINQILTNCVKKKPKIKTPIKGHKVAKKKSSKIIGKTKKKK
mmetsp:Transcript_19880/g.22186  ORF Transcript_19880/g.22186 Transcript_19880/m.22186 type:complete len:143 (-) Transcript_19880:43-471(-)